VERRITPQRSRGRRKAEKWITKIQRKEDGERRQNKPKHPRKAKKVKRGDRKAENSEEKRTNKKETRRGRK